ncbi:fatty acid desaturase [Leptospira sp. GIMC2001]|uniref:fatty acid desaturase n=1 Tax=Leptospira sp. GIMC2001 TaxID=1513297 RepID=UPI00234B99C0|nr:fatty acid desaturase [Leptospira sp. GIMC2001]WCL48401.1 fatty acid desaturase [Leptospira sp. GIMC2001]
MHLSRKVIEPAFKKDPTLSEIKKFLNPKLFEPNLNKAIIYIISGVIQFIVGIGFLYYIYQARIYWLYPIGWFIGGTVFTSLFVLAHDCAHESFFKTKFWNSFWGHILFLPTFYPHHAWRYTHAAHHQNTNLLKTSTTDVYFDNAWIPFTTKEYIDLRKQSKIYAVIFKITRVLLPIGSLIHNILFHYQINKYQNSHKPKVLFSYWILGLFFLSVAATSYLLTESFYPVLHFWIIPALCFQFWMSLYTYLHHTSPDIKIYKENDWNQYRGQIVSTRNCYMPAWLSSLHFHIDIHIPHHLNIRIPSYNLVQAQKELKQSAIKNDLKEEKFTWKLFISTIKTCHLWDIDANRYQTFREVESADK